ncbi:MAG: alanine/glycine:cation symporter family protein [Candidatus Marinimicrobia bacterium]|nr:alanine/glycine:cation symporter family protein [Candidatus Neomarinimicrobiota bacterium]
MLEKIDALTASFAEFMWGTPLLVLLLGGGLFFTLYCRFIPFRFIRHGFNILMGKYDNPNDPGQVSHFQALSSALASTVGMGNISGVAVAIHTGGPGALFWMWVSAIVGMATKFFTCTLAIMYRGTDENGEVQGGPMYVITEGMPRQFHFLAYVFGIAGLFGCFSLFQANQLTQIIQDQIYEPYGLFADNPFLGKLIMGVLMAFVISAVIFGGIRRIGQVASKLVPAMVVLYLLCGITILFGNFSQMDEIFFLIVRDAFTGEAVLGGSIGVVIITGIRRAAFSNEAGIGTEAMAHGAAITKEPVREGLVAMIGPLIDTIIVCSITGFAILSTGVWTDPELNGISMTSAAFGSGLPVFGQPLLLVIVTIFSLTTIIGYSYYGSKCTAFLFGNRWKQPYRFVYTFSLIPAAVISIDIVVNYVDGMFAMMAIPTMISTLILAPRVMEAAKDYFSRLEG